MSQLSVAVKVAAVGTASQLTVMFAGAVLNTGAVLSSTVMTCFLMLTFPHTSVAVQVLVTLYSPAQSPVVVTSADVKVNALPQASVAVATANTGVAGQLMVDIAGKVAITGAVIS